MHCNLRPLVAPVVLDFNHRPIMQHFIKIQQIRTIRIFHKRLSYSDLIISNFSTVSHLGFDRK